MYYIGQIFEGEYPPEAAVWCNRNGAFIEEAEKNVFIIKALLKPTNEDLADQIRMKRNILLNETDKYMIEDYPISLERKEKMKVYRQTLRDLPEQSGFPIGVVFPQLP